MNENTSTLKIFGIVAIISFFIWFSIEFFYISGLKEGEQKAKLIDTYTKFSLYGGNIKFAKLELEDDSIVSAIVEECIYNSSYYVNVTIYSTIFFNKRNYVVECRN